MKPTSSPPSRRNLRLVVAPLAALAFALAVGCIQVVEPQHAVNLVGTSHTITSTLVDLGIPDQDDGGFEAYISFQVIDGPNAGLHSNDGECVPSCTATGFDQPISWTYTSNGIAGLDSIRVCSLPFDLTLEETIEFLELDLDPGEIQDFLDFINEDLGTNFETLEDTICQVVTKEWVEPTPQPRPFVPDPDPSQFPRVGGTPIPLPTAVPTQPPAPVQNVAAITPPATGDGALR